MQDDCSVMLVAAYTKHEAVSIYLCLICDRPWKCSKLNWPRGVSHSRSAPNPKRQRFKIWRIPPRLQICLTWNYCWRNQYFLSASRISPTLPASVGYTSEGSIHIWTWTARKGAIRQTVSSNVYPHLKRLWSRSEISRHNLFSRHNFLPKQLVEILFESRQRSKSGWTSWKSTLNRVEMWKMGTILRIHPLRGVICQITWESFSLWASSVL
jgi:hypothetical protein